MLATRPGGLWFPGTATGAVHESARAEQIGKSREEMFRLLSDLPESEYELSFTDLVEKVAPAKEATADKARSLEEGNSREKEAAVKEKMEKRSSKRRRSNSTGNGGVLLNVYVPSSLTRSLTGSRSRRCSSARERITCCTSRNDGHKEPATFGCWSSIWTKGKDKPRKD